MWWPMMAVTVCGLLTAARTHALPHLRGSETTDEFRNANHIFNAIHSSMRQWGSSWHHNGLSVFPAVVPAGTQFYHGSPSDKPVQTIEWLAFESEHAINFARMRLRRPPPPDEGSLQSFSTFDQRLRNFVGGTMKKQRPLKYSFSKHDDHNGQPEIAGPPMFKPGYLHTYRVKEATPLLYIDGMSAGKCDMGTLDTQDLILLNTTSQHHGFGERERADALCKLATEKWNGKVKGFIRMEAGFEIIMCSFADSLEFVEAVRVGPFSRTGENPHDSQMKESDVAWQWVKSVASRYDGIGGGRVRLDYDNLVTAYSYDLDLFRAGNDLPRLENLSSTSLDPFRRDIDTTLRRWDPRNAFNKSTKDWQSVADMVVKRYDKFLKRFGFDPLSTSEELIKELELILRPFINSDARNITAEVSRCVAQFYPPDSDFYGSVAARSVWEVTESICETLFIILDIKIPSDKPLEALRALVQYLDWSTWKKCPECALDEVCFIPLWPFGAVGDRENPTCTNGSGLMDRFGYWGAPRGLETELEFGSE